jgi:flavodoxin
MKSIVIFASHHGNTMKVAEAIAAELATHGSAQLLPVEYAPEALPRDLDLVVVGGPTEAHHMTEPLARFLERTNRSAFEGVAAAAFDTRLKGPAWLWGSAAYGVAGMLKALGARLIAPPEDFYVTGPFGTEGGISSLFPVELDHARKWAAGLAEAAEAAPRVALTA